MKKFLLLVAIISFTGMKSFAQFSFSAGPSIIKGFGIQGVYPGFHIAGEISNDDVQTMYARFSFMPSQKLPSNPILVSSISGNDNPYNLEVQTVEKFNYSVLEFGKRYYFGDGYESGFGVYGGSNLSLVFNKVQFEVGEYDKTKYQNSNSETSIGSFVGFALGLNGGLKNSFTFGTVFLDAGLSYKLLALASNTIASSSTQYSNLFFTFNLGIRKDFY
jgi:hypothetical protein